MGLYIPNLNLPKGCGDCLFTKENVKGYWWCIINPGLLIDGYEFTRHAYCPLREITIGIDLAR